MTTTTTHRHRAKWPAESSCWNSCVTPDECAAHPERIRAHGWLIEKEYCRCGATRLTERNTGRRNTGPWRSAAADAETAEAAAAEAPRD